jgi:pectate lyase
MTTRTTCGSVADSSRVFIVQDRRAFGTALGTGDTPKIIIVVGEIEANVDDDGSPL